MSLRLSLISALAGLLLSAGLLAQNNPYQIHDDCYQAMLKADELVGKENDIAAVMEANVAEMETRFKTALLALFYHTRHIEKFRGGQPKK